MDSQGRLDWDAAFNAVDLTEHIRSHVPVPAWKKIDYLGRTLLFCAVMREDRRAVRMLLPHSDVNALCLEMPNGDFWDRLLESAWCGDPVIFEWLCRAGAKLKGHFESESKKMQNVLDNACTFAFYGGRARKARYHEHIYKAEQRIARCRQRVVAFLGLKRFRFSTQWARFDRFLIREIALEMWRTRVHEAWALSMEAVDWKKIQNAARGGWLYHYIRCNLAQSQLSAQDSRDRSILLYAAYYGDARAAAYLSSAFDGYGLDVRAHALKIAIRASRIDVIAIFIPKFAFYVRNYPFVITSMLEEAIVHCPECLHLFFSQGLYTDSVSAQLRSQVPPHLLELERGVRACDDISNLYVKLCPDVAMPDVYEELSSAIWATRFHEAWRFH